jgi:peptidoglycan/LPS O-acetylase OafA/YrhL
MAAPPIPHHASPCQRELIVGERESRFRAIAESQPSDMFVLRPGRFREGAKRSKGDLPGVLSGSSEATGLTANQRPPDSEHGARRRVHELDAVRGLAAIAVVFGHLAITVPAVRNASRADGLTVLNAIRFSPLDAVLDGDSAVIVFFVLSGYVLALSYAGGRQTYPGFLARRVARLWIPYIVAVAAGITLAALLGGNPVASASSWFNGRWYGSVQLNAVLEHLSLVGHFRDQSQYVPVIWSLVVEMRISLVFPLLLVALAIFGWRWTIVAAAILTVVAVVASLHYLSDLSTLSYVVCFVAGAALARSHDTVEGWMLRTTRTHRGAMLVLAILLFTYAAWMPPHLLPGPFGHIARSDATAILLGTVSAVMFITLARFPGRGRAFLLSAVPQFFGRVSYSLYLVHTIVLLTIVHLIDPGNVDVLLALLPAVMLISIGLSDLAQRWIERPAQQLGRRIARRVEGRPLTVAGAVTRPLDPDSTP